MYSCDIGDENAVYTAIENEVQAVSEQQHTRRILLDSACTTHTGPVDIARHNIKPTTTTIMVFGGDTVNAEGTTTLTIPVKHGRLELEDRLVS